MIQINELSPDEKVKAFEETWQNPPGLRGIISTVNNQPLGKRFITTSLFFFLIAGLLAILMRVQLAVPENDFMGPKLYNQVFTLHGSTMMFLFTVPFLEGLALYILPMMIGSRDVAFPRLSAFSFWAYLFGGTFFLISFLTGSAPDSGWFSYTPLSGPKYSGIGIDYWVLGLALVEISGICTGIELGVTILKMKARGMSLSKMPLFAWAILVISIMIMFAFTVLLMATTMLEMDRMIGTRFFDTDHGGNSLLWQHLFWFFGHPEVYIMFLPATGIVSTIVATFAKRPVTGYILVALAIVITGFVSFGLWVHHMFATGLPELASSFFTAASLIIATASGIQIFAWVATLWGSKPKFHTPFLWVLGFFIVFVLGGLTGVMVAVVPFDWQVHDTYFVVAHFHYVLIGGVVFPIFGALCYWFPKITGKLLNETIGKWSFWLTFTGFNFTFFPMHIMGLMGLPRRVYTYPKSLDLADSNMLATVGAFIMGIGFLLFIFNIFRSFKKGDISGNNPWQARSFEWFLSSPPPIYSFISPPIFIGEKGQTLDTHFDENSNDNFLLASPIGWRATPITSIVDGKLEAVQWLPGPTLMPFLSALALLVFFTGLLLKLYLLSAVVVLFFAGLVIKWLWPTVPFDIQKEAVEMERNLAVSFRPTGTQSVVWWGMIGIIIVLSTAMGSQVFSYFYLWLYSSAWPQGDLATPQLTELIAPLGLLLISAPPLYWAKEEIRKKSKRWVLTSTFISLVIGLVSFALFCSTLFTLPFSPGDNAYASIFYSVYWLFLAGMLVGLGLILSIMIRVSTEKKIFLNPFKLHIQLANMFWVFNVVAGIVLWITLYLAPNII